VKFFILLSIFLSLSNKEVKEEKVIKNDKIVLENRNYRFLYDICKGDTTNTQKYWGEISKGMKKIVFINIKEQKLTAFEFIDTFRVFLETKVSTGKFKNSTPRGEFRILKKRISRSSRKYGGVMTFWNCITYDESIGIHGLKDKSYEKYLGQPVSHGCIRISTAVSKVFYTLIPIGTKVVIE